MSAKVFTKEELANMTPISMPKAYQRSSQKPLDISTIFTSLEDAIEYVEGESNFGNISYAGQILSVIDVSGETVDVYKIDYDGSLVKLGEGEVKSLSAETYSDGIEMATEERVGQIIHIISAETISGTEYTNGFYIISDESELQKIGTTSASGDISSEVENLKDRIDELEKGAYWLTDEEE